MSPITRLLRIVPVVVTLGAVMGSAQAATQAVAPVTLPKGNHGVDGPFFPSKRAAAVMPSTGTQLQQQAQQRIDARMGGNSVLSNGASVTKAQAQSSGLGFIAQHFDQIDTARSGRVSLSDVKQYLQKQQGQ
ncbi:2-oxoglutarate dehydrogenase [Burkholderia sp. Ac-20365]|jgi:hypothetical protein|uniref:2-oxoglutarate dehydrogenase n=1 Tax=Burkholderia sp. Ac-20365 TaxID=2703897 RepID=UPI00197C7CBD|nr:2-oxoglutarate dehydrogenase [Burkholderia sp. Ac-20365]MBN3759732.1 2-oxoglutarate dehydrogenase [Burkholderia sp. Ac-20365]